MRPEIDLRGLSILNASPNLVEGPDLLHELVVRSSNVDLPAVDYRSPSNNGACISYTELHCAAATLAARMLRVLHSLAPVDAQDQLIIPIIIPQSPALYVGLLAILRVGGAFCPLHLDAPTERLRFILKDVGARLVLADSEYVSKLPVDDGAYEVLSIDQPLGLPFTNIPHLAPYKVPKANDLAYVMYTSGSTGTPKGVGVSHLAATQSLLAHDRHIPPFARFLQFAAPTFDVSVFEIFFPLLRGSTLVCCNRSDMLTDLPGVLRDMRIDACELTPSVAGSLLKRRSDVPGLRLLLTIGEMLTEPVVQEFGGDEHERSLLWGMYGPTEATIHCTLRPDFSKSLSKNNIGSPLDSVSAFIVDIDPSEFRLLPLGHEGELVIGGSQIATGYINRPEQTSATFVNTPWGRVYRTGDKARMLPDGTIECLGRIDAGQVKLNGQRIELGEIEHALLRTSGCHGALAVVISNLLVAFAAVEDDLESAGIREAILAQCKSWLPAYMIPADIKIMGYFPRLPSGKVDKKTLVEEYETTNLANLNAEETFEADLERQLCETAGEILGRRVAPSSRLSSLGLDSLAAIEYASKIRDDFGVAVHPVDILDASTVHELFHVVKGRRDTSHSLSPVELSLDRLDLDQFIDYLPSDGAIRAHLDDVERFEACSPLQEAMIVETLDDSRSYINQTGLHIPSYITTDSIKSWFFALAQQNENFRTGFAHLGNRLHQVVWRRLDDIQVEVVDHARPFQCVDVEIFLRRPFKLEIIPSEPHAKHHTVTLTLHHSIYDGWTIDLLLEDLSRLACHEPLISRPQFYNVSRHLAAASESDMMDAKEFWAEKLRGSVPTPLPNFRTVAIPDPQILTASKDFKVHPKLVRDFALAESIGLPVIFQACLTWLWGAFSGADDIIIGFVSSGRALPVVGIEKIMGPCMTTLPLRTDLSRYTTIIELLQGIHVFNRETLRFGILPTAEIKRAAGVPVARKFFEVIFAYQESLASRRRSSSTIREAWHKDAVEAKILVEISPSDSCFSCQITWHSDAFSEAQIDDIFRYLDRLVDYFVENSGESLKSVMRCFPIDSLSCYNPRPRQIETLSSLSELVERTVSRYPTRNALCFCSSISALNVETCTLTYQELNSKANRIARYLQHRGAIPGAIIALSMDKSLLFYCATLGILKTGCAYLPILPNTPLERIRLILEQAQARFCLVDESSPQRLAEETSCSIVDLASLALSGYPDSNLEVSGALNNLAYVIYTSGTTGAPKGVSVTNANILSNIKVLSSIYPHELSDRMLQACSQAFDMSVFEIFFSWGNGMCLFSATNDTLFEDLEMAIRTLRITHLTITVTVASLLKPSQVPSVRLLVTAGEPMTDAVLEQWAGRLWQGYGPSETTNICTVRKVSRGDSSQYLGWSLENTSAFVFSLGNMELVPRGCIGEFYFGGDQVALGYLGMPEFTADRFFEHREYGRLYRSGDIGCMLPDGSLVIFGRLDTQVKLRGQRIELQEAQAVVLRSGFARACTIMLVTPKGSSSQQLALFYVPIGHEASRFSILHTTDPIRQTMVTMHHAIRAALPDYMAPSFIFPISTLPLSLSGKIDLNLLRRSIDNLSDRDLSFCSSVHDLHEDSLQWTGTETLISEAISQALCVDSKAINRWSSFASLGIDSISAMPLARRLQEKFQKRIPLSLILSNPSVGRLASVIADEISLVTTSPLAKSGLLPEQLIEAVRMRFTCQGREDIDNVLPCTPLQEAMLSSSPPYKARSYYNQMLFRLRLPSQVMKKHWDTMFERHGILRTCFVATEDAHHPIVQVVLKSYLPTWEVFKTDEANFQGCVFRHGSSISAAIDSGEPPVSLAIVLQGDSTEYLSFVCHHAIYDGVSMRHLLAEVEAASHHEQLPTPPSFELFLRETLLLPPEVDDFWTKHLHSFSPFCFRGSTPGIEVDAEAVFHKASNRSLSSIASRLRDLGVSLLSLCQAAWSITLSLLQDNSDVCFGNVVSGRSAAIDRIDTLVAPCFNTIPIRMDLSSVKFLQEVMKKFQQLNSEVIPYQFTGLRRIQSQFSISRLFDTILILQPQAEPLDETIWSLEQEHGAMNVPLVCEITPSREQNVIVLQLHQDASIFPRQTSSLISDIFRHVFDACLEHPSSYVLTVSKLPAIWRYQISQLALSRELTRADNLARPERYSSDQDWTDAEAIIRSLLSRLVNIPEGKIRRHTSIYRYGLDSIGAVQLATLLRRESYAVSAVDVFENPTCAGIASRLSAQEFEKPSFSYDFDRFQDAVSRDLEKNPSLSRAYEAVLPCTPTQQGMISQFLGSKGVNYFNYSSWILEAKVSLWRIAEAWSHLAARHQIFRAGFVPINHQDTSYAMVVYPKGSFSAAVSIRQPSSFDESQWHVEAASNAVEKLSVPPWEVVIVDRTPKQSTMHLAIHHALYDASSLRKALREMASALSSAIEEDPPPIQLALSAHLNPAHVQSTSEAFWREKAKGLVVNKFPIMTPLHVTNSNTLTISRECSASLESFRHRAAEAGITLRAALQAAWTRVLSAYLGEASVTFGVVLDGRTTKEERDAMFPMVTTLPVLARNCQSNGELLEYMMHYNTSLRRYERTPLSRIQRWLGHPDGQLFDTILAYQIAETTSNNGPWEVQDEIASTEYAVALEVVEMASNKLQLNLTYDSYILPAEQANIVLRQFNAVLMDLLVSPHGHANQLPHHTTDLFSVLPADCPQLHPPAHLLHQFVERTARRIPSATALEFVEDISNPTRRRRWTYLELNEMGNRVANTLLRHDTPPGSIVAMCFNKCPEAYFSILGILKAGCAFLSIDPGAPVSRLEFILSDSAAACLLIESRLSNTLRLKTTIPVYDVTERGLLDFPALQLTYPQTSSSDTCYCLYTSGTTGTPKGCLISHDNAVQAMLAFEQLFSGHWDESSRWLQFASFHFDVSVLEQYWSWLVGITVVAAPKDLVLGDITAAISGLDITHIDLTPSLARLIHPDEVPSLCRGIFITGGEKLRQEILQTWGPKGVIYNAYGPTEATIGVTMFQRVPANGRPSNIGTQFPNVGTYVFEPGTEIPVLRGGAGELCVSGRLVGKGYLNRKDLTDERFPVLKRFGERVYRTGDLVRILYDGSFEFLGRVDDQVKLRGQRLEIGEINHAIRTGLSSRLADVATFVTRHLGQDRDFLVSFLAPVASPSLPADLRVCSGRPFLNMSRTALEACRDRLPGYMVPTYVLCVPFIPLSANNKADIKCLKSLFAELPYEHLRNLTMGSISAQRALSEKEQLIVLAISEVTRVRDVDISSSSSVIELGIDSINVARLAILLQSQGYAHASPSLILRHPQISRLAQVLQHANPTVVNRQVLQVRQYIRAYNRHIGMACRVLEIDKADVEYISPCTPLQEGIINRSKATEAQSAYFNQFHIDLDAHVSVSRLKDCWDGVFAECAILRTAFLATSEGYVQVAVKHKAVPWFEIDLGGKEVEILEQERRNRWVFSNQDKIRRPVELDYIEHRGRKGLLLRIFHAVYDGHSFELLLRRVNAKYHHESAARTPTFIEVLPHGPLLKYGQSKPFWKTLFENYTFQPIPVLVDGPAASDIYVSRKFHVSGLETRRIALRVTHQTVLQAAWLVTLGQHFGFVPAIGVIFSGRSLVLDGIENVIGPMFNTLPFRVDLTGRTTWASLIKGVQEYNTSVLDLVHTPLRDIQKWCSNGQPLFDTLLAFNREDIFPSIETRPFWTAVHSIGTLDYPLALEIILLRDASFMVNVTARRTVATEAAAGQLLDEFERSLGALASSYDDTTLPQSPVTADGCATVLSDSLAANSHYLHTGSIGGADFFQSSKLRDIRHEVALLAGLPDDDILETTSFFELGFDSIDCIKLAAKLKSRGFQITLSELMKTPSIKNIVLSHTTVHPDDHTNSIDDGMAKLDEATTFLRDCLTEDGNDLPNITTILPPTPLQDSMVADMLSSDFCRYFNHDVLELSSDVDIDRLKSAWATVHANSPILRTTFAEIASPLSKAAFCQIVREEPLEINSQVELSDLDEIPIVINSARDRAAKANGLSQLLQLTFVTTPTSRYLIISIAHALYDGWSLSLLHADVKAAYEGRYRARKNYEPYLSCLLFNSPIEGEYFWADYLNDAYPTILNPIATQPKSHGPVTHRAELVSALDPDKLKALCRRYRVTPQVLAQGCWAPVLASRSNSLDINFGVVLSGRDTDEAQDLLFPTMNTVPVRIVLHGTITEYFNYLQATMSDILEFQHFPLREVQKITKFKGDRLFNTLFLLQNVKKLEVESETPLWKSVRASSAVEYPICIEMAITEDSTVWRIAADASYATMQDANKMLRDIEGTLQYFAGDHTDVLEYDDIEENVSVCRLESFRLTSKMEDGDEPTLRDASPLEINPVRQESPILDVLSELSGISRHTIDLNHSIYHLGLDSISAIKASSILRRRGLAISVRDLLKAPSIREVLNRATEFTDQSKIRLSNAPLRLGSVLGEIEMSCVLKELGVDEAEVEVVLPALPIQVHMLSVWQNTEGHLFHSRFAYKIPGNISGEMISKAWSVLVTEIPMLRTRFAATGVEEIPFIQIVMKQKPTNPIKKRLLSFGQGKWVYEDTVTPFVSIRIDNSYQEGAYLWLHIHHALYDGISLPIMLDRFLKLCENMSTLPLSTYQARWYEFVSSHYLTDIRQQREKFWTSYLRGINPTLLPAKKTSVAGCDGVRQISRLRRIAIRGISRLKTISSCYGTTLQALFFAAYSKALAIPQRLGKLSSQDDANVFGVYLANRTSFGGLEKAPFPTLSIVPLAVRNPSTRSIAELAVEIQNDILEISNFENTSAGLWEIYNWTGVQIESSVNFLTLPGNPVATVPQPSVAITEIPNELALTLEKDGPPWTFTQPTMDFASRNKAREAFTHTLDIEVAIRGDAMDIGAFYPSTFSETQVEGLIDDVILALEAVSSNSTDNTFAERQPKQPLVAPR